MNFGQTGERISGYLGWGAIMAQHWKILVWLIAGVIVGLLLQQVTIAHKEHKHTKIKGQRPR